MKVRFLISSLITCDTKIYRNREGRTLSCSAPCKNDCQAISDGLNRCPGVFFSRSSESHLSGEDRYDC